MKFYKFFLCLICLLLPTMVQGQAFSQVHSFRQVSTKHFTIIYPPEAEASAMRLHAMVEEIYQEVSVLLDSRLSHRLPVVISPDTDSLNGWFTIIPRGYIALLQASISPNSGFAVFEDQLRSLFLHELTHALSLMKRDGPNALIANLIGDYYAPAFFVAPASFIEGVTVSFESLQGYGRANDPFVAAQIRQAALEERFPSFFEASGVHEGYPGGMWYSYGGWFSRYLQETYGMVKYKVLWEELAKGTYFDTVLFFKGAFEKTYNVTIQEAWADFALWMRPKAPLASPGGRLSGLSEPSYGYILATDSHGPTVWWASATGIHSQNLDKEDEGSTKGIEVFPSDGTVNRIDVNHDGSKILVSKEAVTRDFSRYELKLLDIGTKRELSLSSIVGDDPGSLSEASWLPQDEGIAAIRSKGYTADLVVFKAGRAQVILSGTSKVVPSQPIPQDDGSMVFLLQISGKNTIARALPSSDGLTWRIEVLEAPGLGSVRGLQGDPSGRIVFSNGDLLGFPGLGILDLGVENGSLQISQGMSGGVHLPVVVGDQIVHRGDFARGQEMMILPELANTSLSWNWVALESSYLEPEPTYPVLASQPYYPLLDALYPGVRLPAVKTDDRLTFPDSIQGAGINLIGGDPTGYLSWDLSAQYLWNLGFADIVANVNIEGLPLGMGIQGGDTILFGQVEGYPSYRRSFVSGGFGNYWNLGLARQVLGFGLNGGYSRWAMEEPGLSPYNWDVYQETLDVGASVYYRDFYTSPFTKEGSGLGVNLSYQGIMDPKNLAPPKGVLALELDLLAPLAHLAVRPQLVAVAHPDLQISLAGVDETNGNQWLGGIPWYTSPALRSSPSPRGPALGTIDTSIGYTLDIKEGIAPLIFLQDINWGLGYQGLTILQDDMGLWGTNYFQAIYTTLRLDGVTGILPILVNLPLSLGIRADWDVESLGSEFPEITFSFGTN